MSRPFSYNDKNFTVIGNILLFHINLTKDVQSNSNIIEIPPALYYRINQHTLIGTIVRPLVTPTANDSFTRGFYIAEQNGKYYLKSESNIPGYHIISAYVHLKDI